MKFISTLFQLFLYLFLLESSSQNSATSESFSDLHTKLQECYVDSIDGFVELSNKKCSKDYFYIFTYVRSDFKAVYFVGDKDKINERQLLLDSAANLCFLEVPGVFVGFSSSDSRLQDESLLVLSPNYKYTDLIFSEHFNDYFILKYNNNCQYHVVYINKRNSTLYFREYELKNSLLPMQSDILHKNDDMKILSSTSRLRNSLITTMDSISNNNNSIPRSLITGVILNISKNYFDSCWKICYFSPVRF